MLYRQPESRFWWVQFNHAGKRYRLSTGCDAKTAAAVEARRLRSEVEQEAGPGGRAGVTLATLEELHVARIRTKGYQPRRVKDIENMWAHLGAVLGEHREVMSLTAADLEMYEGTRRGEGAKGQTIRREVQALKLGIKLAKRAHLVRREPFDWDLLDPIASDPQDERQAGKVWPVATIWKVLDALSKKAKTAGYADMLRLLAKTGLRMEELRRLDPEWIHKPPRGSGLTGVLELPGRATKTGTPRALPLDRDCVAIIRRWAGRFARVKFNHALKLASDRAGLPVALTPRDLRATYLTMAATSDLLGAQRLGGHTNVATTGRYLHADKARALKAGNVAAIAIDRGHRRRANPTRP
jgi:integrase